MATTPEGGPSPPRGAEGRALARAEVADNETLLAQQEEWRQRRQAEKVQEILASVPEKTT